MTKKKRNKLNIKVYFVVCIVFMILFDLYTTNYILNNVSVIADNNKYIDIMYAQNTGAAFSSFQHSTVFLILISVAALLFLMYEFMIKSARYSSVFYFFISMLISGIFCNTYERITFGFVRDFISLKFVNFPVFNISDIFINFGVLAIMYLIITKKYLRHD